jgi:hypothetical protein
MSDLGIYQQWSNLIALRAYAHQLRRIGATDCVKLATEGVTKTAISD